MVFATSGVVSIHAVDDSKTIQGPLATAASSVVRAAGVTAADAWGNSFQLQCSSVGVRVTSAGDPIVSEDPRTTLLCRIRRGSRRRFGPSSAQTPRRGFSAQTYLTPTVAPPDARTKRTEWAPRQRSAVPLTTVGAVSIRMETIRIGWPRSRPAVLPAITSATASMTRSEKWPSTRVAPPALGELSFPNGPRDLPHQAKRAEGQG